MTMLSFGILEFYMATPFGEISTNLLHVLESTRPDEYKDNYVRRYY